MLEIIYSQFSVRMVKLLTISEQQNFLAPEYNETSFTTQSREEYRKMHS